MTKILDGKEVGQAIRERARKDANALRSEGIVPKLAIIRIGENKACISYEKSAIKTMKDSDIEAESITLEESTTTQEVLDVIEQLNQDDTVHGVIIMQPLPDHISRIEISSHLQPEKDVDGINPINLGRLVEGHSEAMLPSTPQGVLEILDYYGYELEGVDVVVLGSSHVVGKPLSIMLSNRNATVANPHVYTKDNTMYSKNADILISATGVLGLVDETYVKEGAVVIDVGYGYKDGKATGDVDYDAVYPHASAITPVPGGVGSVTTSVLASQVIKAAKILNDIAY